MNSFQKGEAFEKFVELELFNPQNFTLIYRTSSYDQNKDRFAEDSLKPDLKFRCNASGREFYIEAKYRSGFGYDNKLTAISSNQKLRFVRLQYDEKIPVYVLVGYGGYPSDPDNLSLIPLNQLEYNDLFNSFLRKYAILHRSIEKNHLNLDSFYNIGITSSLNQPTFKSKSEKKRYIGIIASLIILILTISFLSYQYLVPSNEEIIRAKTAEYYETIEAENIDALDNYINTHVIKWYDQNNLTLKEIKQISRDYIAKFPNGKTDIQWSTFDVQPFKDDFEATYELIYKLKHKGKIIKKVYHLKITALWGKNLKIKSLVEERLN